MSTEQFIILLASVEAIAVFVLSFTKVSRGWKAILFILFLAIVVCSTTLKLSHVKEKETKEATEEAKMDQIDTYIRASLSFGDYVEAARINRRAGRIDDAMYDVSCALESNRKSAIALNLLGVLYLDKGDLDSAIYVFTKIKEGLADSDMTMGSGEYIYHRNFGEAYARKGMWKEAKAEFRQCITLNENHITCYLCLATVLDRLKEWREVYEFCTTAVAKFPERPQLYTFLGAACLGLLQLGESEEAFLRAIQVDSTVAQPYLYLGFLYFAKKQYAKSARFLDKATKLDSSVAKDIEIWKEKNVLP